MEQSPERRRGRPRKYASGGAVIPRMSSSEEPPAPPVSGAKRQLDALGFAGVAFTPHVITLRTGEDINAKIMAFSQQGQRCICILSASGAVSSFTLRQPASGGGIVSYEGYFDILSLSGSFLPTDDGATGGRMGGLSMAVAGTDGHVLGGAVAGMLVAASPVQVFMASFILERPMQKPEDAQAERSTGFGSGLGESPPSEGSYESSEEPGSPVDQDDGFYNTSDELVVSSYM